MYDRFIDILAFKIDSLYAKISTIYNINCNYDKIILTREKNIFKLLEKIKKEDEYITLKKQKVKLKYYKNKELLNNNIIILSYWNVSTCENIFVCIHMKVPVFTPKLDSIVEYLGENYPMYYKNEKDIENILNNNSKLQEIINKTRTYLEKLKIDK